MASLYVTFLSYLFDNIYSHNEPWSVVIVVSPLQSLMHDQVLFLRSKGFAAVIAGNDNGNCEVGYCEWEVSGSSFCLEIVSEFI